MSVTWVSAACGVVFALGLGLSGMTDPRRVIGFLDVRGPWDPTLAFVMLGAIGVHLAFARLAVRTRRTIHGHEIALPARTRIDGRLLAGAAVFGIGWGIAGYCPGPAIVALAGGSGTAMVFVVSLLLGTFAFVRFDARRNRHSLVCESE